MSRTPANWLTWTKILATPSAVIVAAMLGSTSIQVRNVVPAHIAAGSAQPAKPGAEQSLNDPPRTVKDHELPKGYRLIYSGDGQVRLVRELAAR